MLYLSTIVIAVSALVDSSVAHITVKPADVRVCVGMNVTIPWEYSFEDDLFRALWSKDNVPIMVKNEDGQVRILSNSHNIHYMGNGKLEVSAVTLKDAGLYSFEVTYKIGTHPRDKDTVQVTVNAGPDNMQLSPNITYYTLNTGETLGPVICSATCTPDCTYNWIKGSSVVSENASLFLPIITKKESGNYSCIATRGARSTDAKSVTLHVRYGPEAISFHPDGGTYTGTENEQLLIKCLSDCYPACTYNWTDEQNSNILSTTDTLHFNPLKREKQGRYKCTVTNEIDGVANPIGRIVTVNVRYGPGPVSFDPTGSPYIGNETETLQVTCISNCYPGCSYTWTKGGTFFLSDGGVLKFSNLHRTHAGIYTCTAENNHTEIFDRETGSVEVKVNYGPDSALLSPPITAYIVNSNTKLDDISCTSDCYPMCSHIWIKYGISSVVVAENGLLQLGVLAKEDAGNYLCKASNPELSMSKSSQVKMYIRYGPDKVSIIPAGLTYSTEEGYTLPDFNCSSECYPGCSQTWDSVTADRDLASGNVLSLGTANRTFTGNYNCTSTNDADEFRKSLVQSVFITVKYHPDVTVSQINGTSITEGSQNIMLICSAKGDPKDYNFTEWIHYAPDGSTQIRKLEPSLADHDKAYVKFSTTSYMDSGTYKCSVTNGIPNYTTKEMFAQADASQVVKGRPVITDWKKDVVSDSHTNSSLVVTYYSNDGSIPMVKWNRAENKTVQERHVNEDNMFFENSEEIVSVEFYKAAVLLPGYRTELFIQNVSQSNFGSYTVSISNNVGTTVLTIHLTAKGAPDSPSMFSIVVNSVTSSSVLLTWICGFHGGADQTFFIQYNTSTSPWQTKAYVDGGQLENTRFNATIDQLSAETQYFFRIFAANVYGNSSFSRRILTATTYTVVQVPSAISSLNVAVAAGGASAGVLIVLAVAVMFLLHRCNRLPGTRNKLQSDAAMGYINGHEYVNMAASSSATVCKAASARTPADSRLTDQPYESLDPERKSSSIYEKLTAAKQSDTQRSAASEYDVLDPETTNKHIYTGIEDPGQIVAEPEAVYNNLMIRNA